MLSNWEWLDECKKLLLSQRGPCSKTRTTSPSARPQQSRPTPPAWTSGWDIRLGQPDYSREMKAQETRGKVTFTIFSIPVTSVFWKQAPVLENVPKSTCQLLPTAVCVCLPREKRHRKLCHAPDLAANMRTGEFMAENIIFIYLIFNLFTMSLVK